MRNKALIILLLVILLAVLALSLTASINGALLLYSSLETSLLEYLPFAVSAVRTLSLLAFTLIYCKTWYSGESPEVAFMDLFLISAALTETRVFFNYTELTGLCMISPVVQTRIILTSVLLLLLSIISSALYYQNNEYGAVSLIKGIDVAASIIMGLLLPIPLSVEDLFLTLPSFWIFILLSATAFIACLIVMFTEPPGISTFKHLAAIFILGGTFAIFFFNLPYANLVGSILLIIGFTANAIFSARNSIRL